MYKLGVIGGMGPLATVKFYDKVVLNTEAHNDNEHIDLIVLNHSTMPDRTKCIIEKKDTEFLKEIKKDLEILEKIGTLGIDSILLEGGQLRDRKSVV